MSDDFSSRSGKPFIPLVLLSVSVISLFIWNLKNISQQQSALQATKLKWENATQTDIPKLEEQAKQSKQIQSNLEKLVLDLMETAKTDPDAKAIVAKYNIRQQAPAASPTPAESDKP